MHTKLSNTLPAWRIVAPDPADDLLAAYRDAEAEFGIPWKYLAAINLVETGIGRIRGTSTAGAQGPMQFMPATWEAYGGGGDINDTHDAIRGAARYLAANNGANDIAHALYRYNHSHRYVSGVQIYADLIAEHPRAFLGFYYWGVWYLTDQGEVYLPVGYEQSAPIPVGGYRPDANLVDPAAVTADEIRNLLGLYCERIDAGDFAGVGRAVRARCPRRPRRRRAGSRRGRRRRLLRRRHAAARGLAAHQAPRHQLGARHRRRARASDRPILVPRAAAGGRRRRCSRSSRAATTTPSNATPGDGASQSVASSSTSSAT